MLSSSLPISLLSCSVISMVFVLLVLNLISLCFILQLPGHLVNLMVPFFQLTSGLCLTSQLCSKNISILFKSITATFNCSLWPLTSISRGTILVTSSFFVLSILKTLNEKLSGFVCILLSLTSYLSIPVCVHLESTSAFTFKFLPFFIFTFVCIFNSHFPLLFWRFEIIYLFWKFTWKISCTVPTQDHHQNSAPFLHLFHLILLELCVSSLTVFLCNLWLYALLCHI